MTSSTSPRHTMLTEVTLDHGWMVQCPDCSRRVWFPQYGQYEVIDPGEFYALHSWSSSDELVVAAELVADV